MVGGRRTPWTGIAFHPILTDRRSYLGDNGELFGAELCALCRALKSLKHGAGQGGDMQSSRTRQQPSAEQQPTEQALHKVSPEPS